jgi:arylsulfatase A-like enzyme
MEEKSGASRPNILLITTDSLRTDALRCMGSGFAHSPHLDRLAGEGVLFTQAHTASPVCMPARCSLLTGLHAPLHGCIENGVERYRDVPVFTDALKDLGYRTIMIGKTHFGPVPDSFDVQETASGEKNSGSRDFFAPLMEERGYRRASRYPNPVPEESCLDSLIVDRTLLHIEEAKREGVPFFAFCSILSPHSPIDPPGRWDGWYSPAEIPPPRFREGEWRELPPSLQALCGLPNLERADNFIGRMREAAGNVADGQDPEEMRRYRALYFDSAAYCDALVGRLLDYLERSGLRENTLVIFTSDHGQQLYDHGFNDKHNFYDESWRVPLILSLPSRLPSGEKREFASTTDLAPTILAAAGGSYEPANGFDLFTPLCKGLPNPRRHAAAVDFRFLALATRRWKLEYYLEESVVRLFDRQNDPGETRNCAEEAALEQVRSKLLTGLLAWRAQMTDISDLRARLSAGGPVAQRAIRALRGLSGRQCEETLSVLAGRVDAER